MYPEYLGKPAVYKIEESIYNRDMMKTLKNFLNEQLNEQLILAVLSGQRSTEGPSKVKIRPVEIKGRLFYQASMTEGAKVLHVNYHQGSFFLMWRRLF